MLILDAAKYRCTNAPIGGTENVSKFGMAHVREKIILCAGYLLCAVGAVRSYQPR